MKIKEISYKEIEEDFHIHQRKPGPFTDHPGIFKKSNGEGYGIRIVTRIKTNFNTNYTTINWDYFDLDATGLIIKSPRGEGRNFNKKVRIIDIEDGVKAYS